MTYILWSKYFALYHENVYVSTSWLLCWFHMTPGDLIIYVGLCELPFMVQQFCLIFWRLAKMNIHCWSHVAPTFDLIIHVNLGQSDLHFVLQLFWLVSWSQVNGWLLAWYLDFTLYHDWPNCISELVCSRFPIPVILLFTIEPHRLKPWWLVYPPWLELVHGSLLSHIWYFCGQISAFMFLCWK